MKLTIERTALLRSLGHVQSVVERRNTIPILSNVLLEASDDALRLTATDLDLAVVESVSATVEQTGAVTTPAHKLYDIVRKLPEGAQVELSFVSEGQKLALNSGRSQFMLACLPKDDFPAMPEDDLTHRFSLGSDDLKVLIDKTRFAISTEETRFYLNGIYIHAADVDGTQMLRSAATDGHRLARVEMPLPEGAAGMPGIIVPRKTVGEVRKLIEDLDGSVKIALSETKIRFDFDNVVLTSKLIDGTFPDYVRVIPTGNDKMLDVDARAFAEAIDRVSTISSEKSRAVKLIMDTDRLILSVNSPESGSATEELAVSYQSEPMEIGFNARYVLDIMDQIGGDNVRLALSDSSAPTLVQDGEDDSALYVLMPMRV